MEFTLPDILIRLLEQRGLSAADIPSFLNPSLADLAHPDELPGIVEAAECLLAACAAGRQIVVFGDYDCDGVSATAILTRTLQTLGAQVEPFIPERLTEGYGMSDASVSRCLKEFPSVGLIVTVDNGINSVEQIAGLKAKGVSVVITDHHLPGEELPAADVIVDPKVRAPKKLDALCGAGVAFLLANRLVDVARARGLYTGPSVAGPLLVLAGLATVTDIMPLLGQNRIFVAEALRRFNALAPIGLRELHTRAARSGVPKLTSRDFGFLLGPRINAAGRLKTSMEALELVLTDDREIARELARMVDGYNIERKAIEQRMTEEALARVVDGAPAQVIDLSDGEPGVAGIVAARVLERLGETVPVCVYASGHGSARSPDGLNIRDAFVACAEYLTTFGGHAAAGGFSVKDGQIDAFRTALCDYCRRVRGETPKPVRPEPELWLEPKDLTLDLADAITHLEPFGEGNPEPLFGLRDVCLTDIKTLGSEGRHLSFALQGSGLRAVWWTHGADVEALRAASARPHTLVFNLIVSEYGERHPELRLVRMD